MGVHGLVPPTGSAGCVPPMGVHELVPPFGSLGVFALWLCMSLSHPLAPKLCPTYGCAWARPTYWRFVRIPPVGVHELVPPMGSPGVSHPGVCMGLSYPLAPWVHPPMGVHGLVLPIGSPGVSHL